MSSGIENAGRRVVIELLPKRGEPIEVQLQLIEDPEADKAHAAAKTPMADSAKYLSECLLLAAWVS
jgi:hypothetical protein